MELLSNRQLIAKFRTSDHCLQIETGRYINIPSQQRRCTTCNILEDEYHFFLNCHLNQQPRNLLINTIVAYYTHMGQAITIQKHANI
jgi:hypothetical protein